MKIFHLQFKIVEVRFSHLGGTRNGTSGARIEKFQKTPKEPKSDSMAGEFNMVPDHQTDI